MVPTCFQCYGEVPVLGVILLLGGCLVQLPSTWKPDSPSGEGAPVEPGRSAYVQACCAWLPGEQSRTVKWSLATKLHHQNSPASTCRVMLRAAVSCCLRNESPSVLKPRSPVTRTDENLLGEGESTVGRRLLAAYYTSVRGKPRIVQQLTKGNTGKIRENTGKYERYLPFSLQHPKYSFIL